MTTKTNTPKFDRTISDIIKAIKATSSPTVLSSVVKAAIHVRDTLLGHEVGELDLKLGRIADAAARKRAKALCDRILKLVDMKNEDMRRKGVATVSKLAINSRSAANKKRAAKQAA